MAQARKSGFGSSSVSDRHSTAHFTDQQSEGQEKEGSQPKKQSSGFKCFALSPILPTCGSPHSFNGGPLSFLDLVLYTLSPPPAHQVGEEQDVKSPSENFC
jgi:hypothetical protein